MFACQSASAAPMFEAMPSASFGNINAITRNKQLGAETADFSKTLSFLDGIRQNVESRETNDNSMNSNIGSLTELRNPFEKASATLKPMDGAMSYRPMIGAKERIAEVPSLLDRALAAVGPQVANAADDELLLATTRDDDADNINSIEKEIEDDERNVLSNIEKLQKEDEQVMEEKMLPGGPQAANVADGEMLLASTGDGDANNINSIIKEIEDDERKVLSNMEKLQKEDEQFIEEMLHENIEELRDLVEHGK